MSADMSDWVYVEDALPVIPVGKDHLECACLTEYGVVTAMGWAANTYAKTEKGRAPKWEWSGKNSPWKVVAWQPLPAPPKEIK